MWPMVLGVDRELRGWVAVERVGQFLRGNQSLKVFTSLGLVT